MSLVENLPLALAIIAGAYVWYRIGFRTPKILRLPARIPRQILIVFGWALLVGIAVKSVGGFFGDGRVSTGTTYAYRTREPMRFWGQIAGEMLMVGGTGAILVALGRRRVRDREGVRDA